MVNRHRGETALVVAGETLPMRLTLGALAELEHAFAVDSLPALGERFEHPAPVADVQNALAAHGDCAVFDARTGHRHHDVRAVDDDLWVHGFESMASPPWRPAPYAR